VFADLLTDFADTGAPHPITVPSSEQFARAIGALGVSNDTHVIVYDQLEGDTWPEYYPFWASRFWWHLRLEGHTKVSVLEGGLAKWKQEGRQIETGPVKVEPTQFTARRQPGLLARVDDVVSAIGANDVLLISALSPAIYSGEKQVYPRAGHIPRSKNVFFGDLIDTSSGRFADPAVVRPLLQQVGALDPAVKPIVYCGSGIAATIVALQLARLGRTDVAVYDGSMTEWVADERRPLQVS